MGTIGAVSLFGFVPSWNGRGAFILKWTSACLYTISIQTSADPKALSVYHLPVHCT